MKLVRVKLEIHPPDCPCSRSDLLLKLPYRVIQRSGGELYLNLPDPIADFLRERGWVAGNYLCKHGGLVRFELKKTI